MVPTVLIIESFNVSLIARILTWNIIFVEVWWGDKILAT